MPAQPERLDLEAQISADVRALTAESDQIGRTFAAQNNVGASDFRALLHIMVAESAGTPLTSGELRKLMGTSGAAVTYLVERMIDSGHLRRDADPADRRKVILRYNDPWLKKASKHSRSIDCVTNSASPKAVSTGISRISPAIAMHSSRPGASFATQIAVRSRRSDLCHRGSVCLT